MDFSWTSGFITRCSVKTTDYFSLLIIITYNMICLFWSQVKGMANPFAYEEYRKEKIRQKIDESRTQRVNIQVRDSEEKCLLPALVNSFQNVFFYA